MNNRLKLQKLFCMAVCFFCIGIVSAFAQEQKVTVELKNATLRQVFKSIERQTTYRFSYRNTLVDDKSDITISKRQVDVSVVLDEALKGRNLTYTIVSSKSIVISDLNEEAAPAKSKRVSGTVKAANGESIIGANIKVTGTTIGCITDVDGNFTLEVPENAKLTISYIGFQTQEITLNGKSSVNIVMKEDAEMLDEVVVIGYGVAKKTDLTGSITQVKSETLENYTPSNVEDLLRTSIPGMRVDYSVSAKGNSNMNIRGNNTLTAGSSPLIVVDGSIYNGDISDINPNDIERLDVMKDASSAAVYGSRATNGVVSITTKKGASSKPTINFSGTVGVATKAKRMKPYDENGFIKWRSDMFKSVYAATVAQTPWSPFDDPRTIDPQYLDQWLAYHSTNEENMVDAWLAGLRLTGLEIENYKQGKYIDWEDCIFHNGLRQDYNLSLSGKKEDFSYYWSLGYAKNEALTRGDEFSTIRSRVNIEGKPAKFLKVGLNAQFSYRDESPVSMDAGAYKKLTPYSSFYEEDGETLRLYPNDDIQVKHPLLPPSFRTREQEYFTFFPKIYSVLELPFGITYTMNYTTRFVFYHN